MSTETTTSGGVVRGTIEDGVAVFRGIPYAAVPERFGVPTAPQRWSGARDATRFGPPPPQTGLPGSEPLTDDGWLTVNVWSPSLHSVLPVMVWVYGGGYVFGTSGLPEYDGGNLARGGVVVVTFNYRVGLEGFGCVDGAPANRGLLDQVAALEWVRDNIGAFGGDAGRITVFGQSAGAGCLAALLAMPRAAGLFHRAIAQSVPGAYLTPELAADVTTECAAELGIRPAELAAVDPHLLPLAVDAVMARAEQLADRWGAAVHASTLLAPVVDGDILPTAPWHGLTGQVGLIVGHTRHEQRLLTAMSGLLGEITEAQAIESAMVFAPDPMRYLAAYADPEELYDVVRSDWLFRMPSIHLADAQRRAGGPVFTYELTWPAPGMGGVLGACHGLDVPLVFGNLSAGQPAMLIGEHTADADVVSAQMRRAWTDFATTGDPGWPTYDAGTTRLFDAEPSVTAYPEALSREIWRDPPRVLGLVDGGEQR